MITGTVRKVGDRWTVEHSYNAQDTPERITVTWRVTGVVRRDYCGGGPELRDGLEVTHETGAGDAWQAYSQGSYLYLHTEREGTIHREPLPAPRLRSTVETRYRQGRWERNSKRYGWVVA